MTGTGTVSDPYILSVATDILSMSLHVSANDHYELAANIDMSGYYWTPLQDFNASIDGKNFTISNLTITSSNGGSSGQLNCAFIGNRTATSGSNQSYIKNLTFFSASVAPIDMANTGLTTNVGVLMGYDSKEVTYTNLHFISCSVYIKEPGNFYNHWQGIMGAILDSNNTPSILSCSVDASSNYFSSSVSDFNANVGGFAGYTYLYTDYCSIRNSTVYCCNTNPSKNAYTSPFTAGGGGYIRNCYVYNTNVTLESADSTSRLVGLTMLGYIISQSYVDMIASASDKNLIYPVATDWFGGINNLYFISGAYEYNTAASGTALSVAQAQTQSSYTGFDFTNVWYMSASIQNGYPVFRYETTMSAPPVSYDILTILTPNGGEKYRFGNTIPITWSVTQSYDLVIQGFVP